MPMPQETVRTETPETSPESLPCAVRQAPAMPYTHASPVSHASPTQPVPPVQPTSPLSPTQPLMPGHLCAPRAADTGLCWRQAFPGQADQAAVVRRMLGVLLCDCAVLDEVLLAADEFVANALRHTRSGRPGGSFIVEVGRRSGEVHIAVSDQGGPTDPAATDADLFAESGRGLYTVSATASEWGWFGSACGRTVVACFRPADRVASVGSFPASGTGSARSGA